MWIGIVYICLAAECFFMDAPPTYDETQCIAMIDNVAQYLETEKDVIGYDVTCIEIQMTES